MRNTTNCRQPTIRNAAFTAIPDQLQHCFHNFTEPLNLPCYPSPLPLLRRGTSPSPPAGGPYQPTNQPTNCNAAATILSPTRAGGTEFITVFSSDPTMAVGGGGFRGAAGAGGIVEALPDRPDPAMLGGMRPVAQEALQVQGVR